VPGRTRRCCQRGRQRLPGRPQPRPTWRAAVVTREARVGALAAAGRRRCSVQCSAACGTAGGTRPPEFQPPHCVSRQRIAATHSALAVVKWGPVMYDIHQREPALLRPRPNRADAARRRHASHSQRPSSAKSKHAHEAPLLRTRHLTLPRVLLQLHKPWEDRDAPCPPSWRPSFRAHPPPATADVVVHPSPSLHLRSRSLAPTTAARLPLAGALGRRSSAASSNARAILMRDECIDEWV